MQPPARRVLACFTCFGLTSAGRPAPAAGAPGWVRVRTERLEYRPAEPVVVTTTNRSRRTIYDDHCGGDVEGLDPSGGWGASGGTGRRCRWSEVAGWRAHSVAIPPGAGRRDTLVVGARAGTGTWRVVLALRDAAGHLLAADLGASNTFHVDVK